MSIGPARQFGKRTKIKGIVLELLEDVGATGLNATDALRVTMIDQNPACVSFI